MVLEVVENKISMIIVYTKMSVKKQIKDLIQGRLKELSIETGPIN